MRGARGHSSMKSGTHASRVGLAPTRVQVAPSRDATRRAALQAACRANRANRDARRRFAETPCGAAGRAFALYGRNFEVGDFGWAGSRDWGDARSDCLAESMTTRRESHANETGARGATARIGAFGAAWRGVDARESEAMCPSAAARSRTPRAPGYARRALTTMAPSGTRSRPSRM